MAIASTSAVHDIELPVLTPEAERSTSIPQHLHQAACHTPFISDLGQEDRGKALSQPEQRRTVLGVGDESKTQARGASSTREVAESVDSGQDGSRDPPIPAYSAIDPSLPEHHHDISLAEITTVLSPSPPSNHDDNPAPTPAPHDTPDPHAPAIDADTLNLLRYNELHGHGGAPVTRAPEAVHLSRHRHRETDADGFSLRTDIESLPAYGENIPPRYSRRVENSQDEPQTLAMLFFKFGFFFPAFWVFGALMLVTPLRSPNPLSPEALASAWPPNHELVAWVNEHLRTEEDKEAFLMKMQQVEIKWAKRCLLAIVLLIGFSALIGLIIFGVLKVG
ncbi:hypothetical protein BJ165DRAFT_1525651 [Panaeolus papilionaceus]|nr:hypothetical protein BJ165DRAFT_1525651 [Panaeolus papilionaceus]